MSKFHDSACEDRKPVVQSQAFMTQMKQFVFIFYLGFLAVFHWHLGQNLYDYLFQGQVLSEIQICVPQIPELKNQWVLQDHSRFYPAIASKGFEYGIQGQEAKEFYIPSNAGCFLIFDQELFSAYSFSQIQPRAPPPLG